MTKYAIENEAHRICAAVLNRVHPEAEARVELRVEFGEHLSYVVFRNRYDEIRSSHFNLKSFEFASTECQYEIAGWVNDIVTTHLVAYPIQFFEGVAR